ncbi:sulfotransferase family 2 domain-containing protein [Kiritimatiella glycovorans]|uniref:Sulfotransferase family protein n=1 Tax=Kiritimatiella glycovorans TaxID=1307763 RepID=A0A0G3EGP0_9BACT|nr:sulfotransferase family 2 domain-containing protein [Kiritimatiella glycovorans]AKJ65518.1 hypothetical protein L21SP4_02291 [Kiritimatiella glycovorans]
MPRFIHPERNYYLSTSCKVLYTTLTKQAGLQELSNVQFARALLFDALRGHRREHYMFVRNPYDRVVSCFADKFRRSPPQRTPDTGWQTCQVLAFPFLGLSEQDDFEQIRERLLQTTFIEFVRMLPAIYREEPHFYPQHFMLHPRLKKRIAGPRIRLKKWYRIETELKDAARDLGLDLSIRTQKSDHGHADEYYDSESRAIVNGIYQRDFDFGYPMSTAESTA